MSIERQQRVVRMGWTMERGSVQVPARMVVVKRAPVPVPDIRDTYTAAGGRVQASAFRPVAIDDPAPWADVWGDAR